MMLTRQLPGRAAASAATQAQQQQQARPTAGALVDRPCRRRQPRSVAAAAAAAAAAASATAAAAPVAAKPAPTASSSPPPPPPPAPVRDLDALPADLRRMVASVDLSGDGSGPATRVLILGVSGASRRSAERAARLVRLARPEAVVLGLCRERAALLVDPDSGDATANAAQTNAKWHCRRVRFEGLPVADDAAAKQAVDWITARLPADYAGPPPPPPAVVPNFPPAEDLLKLVRTRPGVPVGVSDIEEDVRALLASGLFGRARPFCESGGGADAPLFAAVAKGGGGGKSSSNSSSCSGSGSGSSGSSGSSGGSDSGSGVALRFVPPLASTRFIVAPRVLPAVKQMAVRVDSSARGAAAEKAISPAQLEAVGAAAQRACRSGTDDRASLGAYATARAELLRLFGDDQGLDFVVTFSGVEGGRPEALVRRRRPAPLDPPFVSGLEASASGGEGVGIEAFKPLRQGLKLSRRMTLPPSVAQRVIAEAAAAGAEAPSSPPSSSSASASSSSSSSSSGAQEQADEKEWSQATAPPRGSPVPGWSPQVPFREWTADEADDASAPGGVARRAEAIVAAGPAGGRTPPPTGAAAALAAVLSGVAAGLTSRAAASTGVGRGAAWRAALDAATEVGARAVVLADRPQSATQRRVAETVAAGEGAALARLGAAGALLVAGIVGAATHAVGPLLAEAGAAAGGVSGPGADAAVLAVGVAAAAAALAPVAGPLLDAWRFSRLSAEDVERDVALPDSVPNIASNLDERLTLGGEDALLRWPGAWRSLVDERDAFFAAVTAATAAGRASGAPAYVADLVTPPQAQGGSGGDDALQPTQQQQQQQQQQQLVWRLMAGARQGGRALDEGGPGGAAGRASLPGRGDGEYSWPPGPEQRPRCVVAVVGAPHVRGIVRRWEWASKLAREAEAEGGGGEAGEAALASLLVGGDAEAEAVARAGDKGSV